MMERFQDAEFSWHCCPQKTVTIPRSVRVLYLLITQPSLIRSFHSSDPCFSVSCPKGVGYARVYCNTRHPAKRQAVYVPIRRIFVDRPVNSERFSVDERVMFENNRLDQSPRETDFSIDITKDNIAFCAVLNDVVATARRTVFHVIHACPSCIIDGEDRHRIAPTLTTLLRSACTVSIVYIHCR